MEQVFYKTLKIMSFLFIKINETYILGFLLANTSFQENEFVLSLFSYIICGGLSYCSTFLLVNFFFFKLFKKKHFS